jgi:hypothetical protein
MLSQSTLLSAEVEGRPYGGGVLKLETKEAERLLVPRLAPDVAAQLTNLHQELSALIRQGRMDRASRIVDAILGLDPEPLAAARQVLVARRSGRTAKGSRRSGSGAQAA